MQVGFRLWGYAAVAGILVTALGACKPSQPPAPPAPPPSEVNVVVVEPHEVAVNYEYIGQIAGFREAEVRPRISGILEHWNYEAGAKVKAGQSMFTLDSGPYRAALAKAEADLAAAEATAAQSTANVERLRPLWEPKAISQKDFDDAQSAEKVGAANVKSAAAAVSQARLNMSYTRVEAPISGITSRPLKSEGSLVDAQQTLLTTISQIDPVYVNFSFTEAEHLKFNAAVAQGRLRLPADGKFDVKLKLADGGEYARAGKVDFTDVRVDPVTGTIEARAIVPNPQGVLRPGQFARVVLSGGQRPDALVIPQRAVLEGPKGKMVLIVNAQNVVEPRPIEVGDWTGADWVILNGLKSGDRVIVDGMIKAPPGASVKVTQLPADGVAVVPAPPGQPPAATSAASAAKPAAPAQPAK